MAERASKWLVDQGISETLVHGSVIFAQIILILVLAKVADWLTHWVLRKWIRPLVQRTKTNWDDAVIQHGVLARLAHLTPASIIYAMVPPLLAEQPQLQAFVIDLIRAYMALVVTMALDALVCAMKQIFSGYNATQRAPLQVLTQAGRIIVWVVGTIFMVSALFDKSPTVFVSGLGAMTAVTALIFKDSIIGLVAGFQISGNDLVRVGDWITMPNYNADGTVLEIGLTTVKIQNWDMTIASVPSQAIVNDSFRNWRGMDDSGGRRIKRSINLDMTSVRFCDDDMIQQFSKIRCLKDYIQKKQTELAEWNKQQSIDESVKVNGRRLTNLGVFRAYLQAYLRENPNIHTDSMTFLVRQLQPGPTGMPMEIYVFSKDQRWVQYEGIQSDIFDHVLASLPEFDLRVFQEPTGADLKNLRAQA